MSPSLPPLPVAAAASLAATRAALPGALIALDFDGTLAHITLHPDDAVPLAGVAPLLRLARSAGSTVAIITGRTVESLLRVTGFESIPGIVVYGLHGVERWEHGHLTTPRTPRAMPELRNRLTSMLRGAVDDPAVWVEDKRLSLVVHTRSAGEPARLLAELRPAVDRIAQAAGMDMRPGKDVLEIVLPGIDKGTAIDELVAQDRSAVIYAGDDSGDVPAFERVKAWGRRTGRPAVTLAVTPRITEPLARLVDVALPEPNLLLAVLGQLVAQDGSAAAFVSSPPR